MSDVPERIWTCDEEWGRWIPEDQSDTVEYVRADIHDALRTERDATRAENARIKKHALIAQAEWERWIESEASGTTHYKTIMAEATDNRAALDGEDR